MSEKSYSRNLEDFWDLLLQEHEEWIGPMNMGQSLIRPAEDLLASFPADKRSVLIEEIFNKIRDCLQKAAERERISKALEILCGFAYQVCPKELASLGRMFTAATPLAILHPFLMLCVEKRVDSLVPAMLDLLNNHCKDSVADYEITMLADNIGILIGESLGYLFAGLASTIRSIEERCDMEGEVFLPLLHTIDLRESIYDLGKRIVPDLAGEEKEYLLRIVRSQRGKQLLSAEFVHRLEETLGQ